MIDTGSARGRPIGKLSTLDASLLSIFSTSWARTVCAPFDVVRTMQQVEFGRSVYSGTIPTIGQLYRDEGTRAFWKGNTAGLVHNALHGTIRFALVGAAMNHPAVTRDVRSTAGVAICSALLASLLSHPFDLLATRMIIAQPVDPSRFVYSNVGFTARSIVKKEGYRGLFRGLLPGTLFCLAFELTVATAFTAMAVAAPTISREHLTSCGLLVAAFGQAVAYPFDVVKRRLQVQHAENFGGKGFYPEKYSGTLDCFRKMIAAEGTQGLYRGFAVTLYKVLPFAGVQFLLYEAVKQAYILWETQQIINSEENKTYK